jgi:uncharacterized membrane protein YphA (DoxX/SURF4 family)
MGWLLLQDQLRWQPWVYMYALMLIPFTFAKKPSEEQLQAFFRLLLIAVYIWSGVHKIHPNFVNTTFENIINTYLPFVDKELLKAYFFIGYLAPIYEIAVGIFLFIPSMRKVGIVMVLMLHTFIICYLSPIGIDYNAIVIPWNVAMAIMVGSLFCEKHVIHWRSLITKLGNRYLQLALILVLIMPALSVFQLWDHYLMSLS